MGLFDDYWDQRQFYASQGSLGSGLLSDRPSMNADDLQADMEAASKEFLRRSADPVAYYQENPAAQGLLDVTPEMDIIDLVGGLAPKAAMFLGAKAAKAPLDMLGMAQKMDAAGVDRDLIWKNTGWGQGADKKWRFEIPDDKAKARNVLDTVPDARQQLDDEDVIQSTLGQAISHPRLREQNKGLFDDIDVEQKPYSQSEGASYGVGTIRVPSDYRYGGDSAKGDLSHMLHEVQHAIQDEYGFASGANSSVYQGGQRNMYLRHMIDRLRANPKNADVSDQAIVDHAKRIVDSQFGREQFYKKSAGEVEARNTEARALMDWLERRNTPPWKTADIDEAEQIVHF